MSANLTKSSRSETVRRRRLAQTKRRYDSSSARASSTVRPLVGQPRRSHAARGRKSINRRRIFGVALPAAPDIRRLLAIPALPRRISWRVVSLSMCLLLGAMMLRLLSDPMLFVEGIGLGGSALVPGDEIYAESGIAGQHIFWVDPAEVKRNIEAVPGIASAEVEVEWPNIVTIVVVERIPVVTWVENDKTWWVDADGQKFKARDNLPGLLPIHVDETGTKASDAASRPVPADAIHGALQLRELRPNIEMLYYHPLHGLSYQDGRGWRGYFGVGTDMPQKLAVYETLTDNLTSRGVFPRVISVENLNAPFYQR